MIYSRNDIQDFYTKVLDSYLIKGYMVNVRSMRGSQGEDAKIDLVKDDQIVRILAESDCVIRFGDVYKILVLGYKDIGADLYWNNRGDILEEYYFIRTEGRGKFQLVDKADVNRLKLRLS